MLIPINDRFRITSDSRQWMIQRRRSRNGKEKWESRHYFGTLKAALKDLGELMVRESKTDTLADALEAVEKVTTTLCHALTPQLEQLLEVRARENQQ